MKKLGAILFAAVLLIGAGTTDVCAGACGHGSRRASCAFVDENNDGICDNCGGVGCVVHDAHGGFLDEDGDGICDSCGEGVCGGIGCGSHHAHGGFLDEDGDGICDHCAEGICPQKAAGRGHHKKGGHHRR